MPATPGGRAVYGVCVRPLDCSDREFEHRCGHGCSFLVFVVCCVGSGLWDELFARSENRTVCVCVCVCLILCRLETSTMSCVTDYTNPLNNSRHKK